MIHRISLKKSSYNANYDTKKPKFHICENVKSTTFDRKQSGSKLMHISHITSNDPSIFATKQNRSKFNARKQNALVESIKGPITTSQRAGR